MLLMQPWACKKDDSSSSEQSSRIVKQIDSLNGTTLLGQITFEYESDHITKEYVLEYHEGVNTLDTITKHIFDYSDNQLSSITYSKESLIDWTPTGKIVCSYNNGLMTELMEYTYIQDDAWQIDGKYTLTYKDGSLSEEDYYSYYAGDWILVMQDNYAYTDGLVVESTIKLLNNGIMINNSKSELEYSGTDISQIINYDWDLSDWRTDSKVVYDYQGNNVVVTSYSYESGSWVPDSQTETYTFNADGLVKSYTYMDPIQGTYTSDYTYESGKGNYRSLFPDLPKALLKFLPAKSFIKIPSINLGNHKFLLLGSH